MENMNRPLTPPEVRELLSALDVVAQTPIYGIDDKMSVSGFNGRILLAAAQPCIRATLERYAALAESAVSLE